jgi:hypothetical protein
MSKHLRETDLALFLSGDMNVWKWISAKAHTARCERCRDRVRVYRQDRELLKQECGELPQGLNWERLSAEMTANIRVGLAAGECVAPRARKRISWGWQPFAIGAGAVALLALAFWLNLPAASDTETVTNALHKIVHRTAAANPGSDEPGPVVEATASGVKWRENGTELRMPQGEARPVSVSVDGPGSASARYIEPETFQVTITSVYVQ